MSIEVSGIEDSPEADQPILERVVEILRQDPAIKDGFAIANYQVPGNEVSDCDLLLCLRFKDQIRIKPFEKPIECGFSNLLMLLELKRHRTCELHRGALYVRYGREDRRKNATKQSKQVVGSLAWYLDAQEKRYHLKKPWVYGGLYLANVPFDASLAHPIVEERTIFKDAFSLRAALVIAAKQLASRVDEEQQRSPGISDLSSWKGADNSDDQYQALRNALGFFAEARKPAAHDRRRVEVLTQKRIATDAQYLKQPGNQLLIFKGRAGTGKTARLLGLARHFKKHGISTMLVTYNHALAVDLRRLVNVFADLGEPIDLPVRTIGQVLFRIAAAMGDDLFDAKLQQAYDKDFQQGFEMAVESVGRLIGGADADEMRDLMLSELPEFDVDYMMVDEGQDWHPREIELMGWIAGDARRLIVAVGPDQNTREYSSDWERLSTKRQTVACTVNVRQKPALHEFNRRLSDLLGDDWSEAGTTSDPGTVRMVPDRDLQQRSFWDQLDRDLGIEREDGNRRADVLIFEPSWLKQNRTTELAQQFKRPIWDGTDGNIRSTTSMLDPNEYRLLYYESARGLESWVAILRLVDLEFDAVRKRLQKATTESETSQKVTPEDIRNRWLRTVRIAATRPIDTLILTYDDKKSEATGFLSALLDR